MAFLCRIFLQQRIFILRYLVEAALIVLVQNLDLHRLSFLFSCKSFLRFLFLFFFVFLFYSYSFLCNADINKVSNTGYWIVHDHAYCMMRIMIRAKKDRRCRISTERNGRVGGRGGGGEKYIEIINN